jgi:hypothetical protein
MHQIVQAIRRGEITSPGGEQFHEVVYVGHSYGTLVGWNLATGADCSSPEALIEDERAHLGPTFPRWTRSSCPMRHTIRLRSYRRPCAGAGTGECGKASAARTLEGNEHAIHPTRPDPALDLDCGDGLELPPIVRLIVKDLLKLVTGHLAPEQALAKLDHLVLVTGHHAAS